jgi:hypothetical protein
MTSLPLSAPHAGAPELRHWTLDSYDELKGLRASLRDAIVDGAPPSDVRRHDVFDRVAVVATELATNALRHGLPPTVVRLLRDREQLIVDVADNDPAAAPVLINDRAPGAGGLGLQLTRTFAGEVGWYTTDVTKHVWASFPS